MPSGCDDPEHPAVLIKPTRNKKLDGAEKFKASGFMELTRWKLNVVKVNEESFVIKRRCSPNTGETSMRTISIAM